MIRKVVKSDYEKLIKYYRLFDDSQVELFPTDPFAHLLVYELDNQIVGFVNYSIIYERAEINYIYIEEEYRNKHIASEFMELIITDAIDSGCVNISLEVSVNNKAGLALYEKYGFEKMGMRKKYYNNKS